MKRLFFFFLFSAALLSVKSQSLVADTTLKDYVGKYTFPDGSVVPFVEVVLADSSSLTMTSDAGTSSLLKLGVDSFSIVEFSGTAVFQRGEDKKVKSVHIEAAGYILDGEKVPAAGWSFRIYILPPNKELLLVKE